MHACTSVSVRVRACARTCVSVCTVQKEHYGGWEAAGTDVEGVCLGEERDEGEESQKGGGENGESSCSPSRPKLKRKMVREGWTPIGLPGGKTTPERADLEREGKSRTSRNIRAEVRIRLSAEFLDSGCQRV